MIYVHCANGTQYDFDDEAIVCVSADGLYKLARDLQEGDCLPLQRRVLTYDFIGEKRQDWTTVICVRKE